MRILLIILLVIFALTLTTSCLFDSVDVNEEEEEYYLTGTVTDVDGNPITGAEIHVVYDFFGVKSRKNNRFTDVTQLYYTYNSYGQLKFSWTTTMETNLLGFNVLGGDPGENNVINFNMIPASNTSQPYSYNYTYTQNPDNYSQYYLQIVDLDYNTQINGPFIRMPVQIAYFSPDQDSQQQSVVLHWSTVYENEVNGFNIYRSLHYDFDTAIMINPSIISATNIVTGSSYSFTDVNVENHTTYHYWLQSVLMDGSSLYNYTGITTNFLQVPDVVEYWNISAYPNPSPGDFSISYTVYDTCNLVIEIRSYDSEIIRTIVNEEKLPGSYTAVWDGKNSNGIDVSNGLYKMKCTATRNNQTLYQVSRLILKSKTDLSNKPVTYSSSSGYSIPIKKYFWWDEEIEQTDDLGYSLGHFSNVTSFTIYVVKEGYETASRHINLNNLAFVTANFTLESGKSILPLNEKFTMRRIK